MTRATGAALLAVALAAAPAAGQEPWRDSYFPYVTGGPTDGVMGIVRYQVTRNAPYFLSRGDAEDVLNPLSFAGAFSAEAGAGTRGSRFVSLLFRGPGLVDGWRFHGTLEARREGRFGFYGLGPDAAPLPGGPPPLGDDDFYRARRDRYVARAEVTRTVAGPLRLAVAGSVEHTAFRPFGDPGSLALTAAITGTDAILRAAVVLDTRDQEFVPANGVLAEAGVYTGTDGTENPPPSGGAGRRAAYTGGYLHLRGFVSPREGTVLAGRFALRGLSEGAPLSARYMLPGWERDVTVLGGVESHRGYVRGRYGGRGVILGGLEVRHDLLNAGDFGAITLLAFADGGRVFEGEGARLTARGWEVGYGGGVALRVLRSAVLTFNFAGGGDGFTFGTGTGWTF
jgi:hypothetical protein